MVFEAEIIDAMPKRHGAFERPVGERMFDAAVLGPYPVLSFCSGIWLGFFAVFAIPIIASVGGRCFIQQAGGGFSFAAAAPLFFPLLMVEHLDDMVPAHL